MAVSIRAGTMVVVIQVNEGLVVCADKRINVSNPIGGNSYSDTATKIYELSRRGGFFSLGATAFADAETGRVRLDVDRATQDFWQTKDHSDPAAPVKFQHAMLGTLKSYLRSIPLASWPDTRMVDGEPILFDVVTFFIDENDRFRTIDYQFLYGRMLGNVGSRIKDCSGQLTVFGGRRTCCRLFEAIESDSDFGVYREEATITKCKQLFEQPCPHIEVETAVTFGHRLIEVASKHECTSGISTISPICDCVLLSREHGFQWRWR